MLQEYVAACPPHGMDEWLILQSFYNGLTPSSRDHLDASVGGAFFSMTIRGATDLIEKMVSIMGWSGKRLQTRERGMHTVKETETLAANLDLLMKRLDDQEKNMKQGTVKALDSHITCEVCGNTGHPASLDCPEIREEVMFITITTTRGTIHKEVNGGTSLALTSKEVTTVISTTSPA